MIHNLTTDADRETKSEEEFEAYFEQGLKDIPYGDLMFAIYPSLRPNNADELAKYLNSLFQNSIGLKLEFDQGAKVLDRLKLYQDVSTEFIGTEQQDKIEAILRNIRKEPYFDTLGAPILNCLAKHTLSTGNFKEAEAIFKQAIDCCEERSYGGLRGELAHNYLATANENGKLSENNHGRYFRMMIRDGMIMTTIEGEEVELYDSFFQEIDIESVSVEELLQIMPSELHVLSQGNLSYIEAMLEETKLALNEKLSRSNFPSVETIGDELKDHFNKALYKPYRSN